MKIVASPAGSGAGGSAGSPTGTSDSPVGLAQALLIAEPGDEILLRGGSYPGTYILSKPGVLLTTYEDEPAVLTGPVKPTGDKPAWLRIAESARGARVERLTFAREGAITQAKNYNDFGVIVEAEDALVAICRLYGMTKGIHVKGKAQGITLIHNHIGPTYQSNIVCSTSYGVFRRLLIAFNLLEKSYIEDGIQFMQDFDANDPDKDISNFGTIIYDNLIRDHGENGIDLKGAAYVLVEDNELSGIAGSNNGPLNGWNHGSNSSIMKGANASTRDVLIRNNRIAGNCSGPRMFEGWKLIHNEILDNNYSPEGAQAGYGIGQMSAVRSAAKNNLVRGHKDVNLKNFTGDAHESNLEAEGPGVALTKTKTAGRGHVVALDDAGYFTDWFGRANALEELIYIGQKPYLIVDVDYDSNQVTLAEEAEWEAGEPVSWRSPEPVVGNQRIFEVPPIEPPVPPVIEPPPIEPPDSKPEEPPVPPDGEPVEPPVEEESTIEVTFRMTTKHPDALMEALSNLSIEIVLSE